jgi:RNA polymerase sigma-70 factor (ECF subfamily)
MIETSELEAAPDLDFADSPSRVSQTIASLSDTDLLRLQALARLRARGLPRGIGWSDLLHEAIVRALDGSRQWPAGLPFLAFMAGVMRSLCDEMWRRRRREVELIVWPEEAGAECTDVASPEPDQERVFAAVEAITAIHRLFAADRVALRIVAGLENGLSAEEIRQAHDLSALEYDTARRRMRRALVRAGLSWSAS